MATDYAAAIITPLLIHIDAATAICYTCLLFITPPYITAITAHAHTLRCYDDAAIRRLRRFDAIIR